MSDTHGLSEDSASSNARIAHILLNVDVLLDLAILIAVVGKVSHIDAMTNNNASHFALGIYLVLPPSMLKVVIDTLFAIFFRLRIAVLQSFPIGAVVYNL